MKVIKIAIIIAITILPVCLFAQTVHKKTSAGTHTSLAATMANGKKIYLAQCLSCHQADGGGVSNMNPPLIKTSYVLGDKPALIKIVLEGFKEDVEINGQTYSNNMPPHDYMKDQEIADVLTYVRNSFTNKASAVKVSEVKKQRALTKK